ncbi:hypothetical protein PoMZ_09488 [Pyricularia oryzae]|uniref:Uncharacterized protein n=1 Tax=Pyricularia oryzae TaxID=318829 RepID=A0A4P7MUN6_PYROR|nr:hypothetical protein PoMZ_09488 [Pyricularia oryzae]
MLDAMGPTIYLPPSRNQCPTRDARELEMARAATRLVRDKGGRCEARYCLFGMEAKKKCSVSKFSLGLALFRDPRSIGPQGSVVQLSTVPYLRYMSSAI